MGRNVIFGLRKDIQGPSSDESMIISSHLVIKGVNNANLNNWYNSTPINNIIFLEILSITPNCSTPFLAHLIIISFSSSHHRNGPFKARLFLKPKQLAQFFFFFFFFKSSCTKFFFSY